MGKKGKLYLIILINLIAWGYVGNKVYCALQGDDNFELTHEKMEIKKISETKKEDNILLALNYPDPFLKENVFSKKNQSNPFNISKTSIKTPASQSVEIKKEEVSVPTLDVKYVGLVKNNDKGTQTSMISINGKSFLVKQKDIVEGFTVQEVTTAYIKLKKGKEVIIVSK